METIFQRPIGPLPREAHNMKRFLTPVAEAGVGSFIF